MLTKFKFALLKTLFFLRTGGGIYFTPCSVRDLGYIDQTRKRLKCRIDAHRHHEKKLMFTIFSLLAIAAHTFIVFILLKQASFRFLFSHPILDFHKNLYIFKTQRKKNRIKNLLISLYRLSLTSENFLFIFFLQLSLFYLIFILKFLI